jgi:hypothetical protein
MSTTMGFSKR